MNTLPVYDLIQLHNNHSQDEENIVFESIHPYHYQSPHEQDEQWVKRKYEEGEKEEGEQGNEIQLEEKNYVDMVEWKIDNWMFPRKQNLNLNYDRETIMGKEQWSEEGKDFAGNYQWKNYFEWIEILIEQLI